MNLDDVQQMWNNFENEVVKVVDSLTPLTSFLGDYTSNTHPDILLKHKIIKKRRLIKQLKAGNNPETRNKLRELNKEIVFEIKLAKKKNIRRRLVPGNQGSLWNAVNSAKDINPNKIPSNMKLKGKEINQSELAENFATFFENKVKDIVKSCKVDDSVYNGTKKVTCNDHNFMSVENIVKAFKTIKIKNCEGFDRIPQRILIEGMENLIVPAHRLFNLIYRQKKIPEQWSMSKIIPIYKKGSKSEIENYRPIANLCSMTKVFEQLIIIRLKEIEAANKCDLTGNSQHGFKQNRSTATCGLTLQSILTRALDQNKYAIMSSIDLSAAFDVVNTKLLIKRLKIIGLPNDVVELIEIWLKNRMFYVSVEGQCSYIKLSETGTIQGSRLGPILYAIFVSPLFDLEKMSNYADDNFIIRVNCNLAALITDMEKSLEAITKWLKKSGLKVNESKTEVCLFHRNTQELINITINSSTIRSKLNMNVLGVIFDSRLKWNDQVSHAISKSNSALHCIRLIKQYFNAEELGQIITSLFYSVLYYNSEIWNIPTIHKDLKTKLLSASSNALKLCTPTYHDRMSYIELHKINKRATPVEFCNYKHALLLYKLIHTELPGLDWIDLNFQQTLGARCKSFNFFKRNNYRVGENLMCNRLSSINGKIDFELIQVSIHLR